MRPAPVVFYEVAVRIGMRKSLELAIKALPPRLTSLSLPVSENVETEAFTTDGDRRMTLERVLIAVKTYPRISAEHIETVCTGAINDQGQWRRIYPVEFRYLDDDKQYRIVDIVELGLEPSSDSRPESRRPDLNSMTVARNASLFT